MHKRTITAVGVTATTVLATALTGMGTAVAASSSASAKAVPHTQAGLDRARAPPRQRRSSPPVDARVYLAPRGGSAALEQTAHGGQHPR